MRYVFGKASTRGNLPGLEIKHDNFEIDVKLAYSGPNRTSWIEMRSGDCSHSQDAPMGCEISRDSLKIGLLVTIIAIG